MGRRALRRRQPWCSSNSARGRRSRVRTRPRRQPPFQPWSAEHSSGRSRAPVDAHIEPHERLHRQHSDDRVAKRACHSIGRSHDAGRSPALTNERRGLADSVALVGAECPLRRCHPRPVSSPGRPHRRSLGRRPGRYGAASGARHHLRSVVIPATRRRDRIAIDELVEPEVVRRRRHRAKGGIEARRDVGQHRLRIAHTRGDKRRGHQQVPIDPGFAGPSDHRLHAAPEVKDAVARSQVMKGAVNRAANGHYAALSAAGAPRGGVAGE